MDKNIEITRAKVKEFEDIYNLHNKYFGNKRSKYTWKWEYGNKNPNKSILVLAKDDNKIIATQGMMSVPLIINGKRWISGKSESTLIESNYRGTGLFTPLYNLAIDECSNEGMVCIWGFTKKALGPLKKVNFRIFYKAIKVAILPLNYRTACNVAKLSGISDIKVIFLRIIIKLASLYSSVIFCSRKIFINKQKNHIEITNVLKSYNDIIYLFERLRKKHINLIHIYMDESYINWRISNSPNRTLSFFAYDEDKLEGYLFLTIRDKYIELTDFTFNKKSTGLLLIKNLIEFVDKNNIGFLSYSGNIHNAIRKNRCGCFLNLVYRKLSFKC
jgi:hypothetical protein